jgi:hypothetical protein
MHETVSLHVGIFSQLHKSRRSLRTCGKTTEQKQSSLVINDVTVRDIRVWLLQLRGYYPDNPRQAHEG